LISGTPQHLLQHHFEDASLANKSKISWVGRINGVFVANKIGTL
jgi:hypothetical protein